MYMAWVPHRIGAEAMRKELFFLFERETPGTYRFKEDSQSPIVGALYVKKGTFETKPERIKMTLEW